MNQIKTETNQHWKCKQRDLKIEVSLMQQI